MSDRARVFLDTNLLVYLFDRDAPAEKRQRAARLLQEEAIDGRAVISTQVLQEFYVALTSKLARPVPSEEAEEAVRNLNALPVIQVDPQMVLAAIRQGRHHRLNFWDALIYQAAVEAGCDTLLTEDLNDGQQIGPVRIENPFLS